jgi:hypothetical protein
LNVMCKRERARARERERERERQRERDRARESEFIRNEIPYRGKKQGGRHSF